MKVQLSVHLARKIHKHADSGVSGGFQNHMADTVKRLDAWDLTIDDAYLGQTWRHAYCYKGGGWQTICQHILSAIAFHHQAEAKT